DDQTVFAAEADLSKIEPQSAEQWVRQVVAATGALELGPKDDTQRRFDESIAQMKRWLADFTKSGGKQIYMVTNGELMKDAAIAIIAPFDEKSNPKVLASLLYSVKIDGQTRQLSNINRTNGGLRYRLGT